LCEFSCFSVTKKGQFVCVSPAGIEPLYRKARQQEEKTCGKEVQYDLGRAALIPPNPLLIQGPAFWRSFRGIIFSYIRALPDEVKIPYPGFAADTVPESLRLKFGLKIFFSLATCHI
jgi:hypothetical protein